MIVYRRVKNLFYHAVKNYFDDGCSQRSAAISYYVLFSIFPLVIFSISVLGLLLRNEQLQADVVDSIMENIPLSRDEAQGDVTEALEAVASTQGSALGVIGLLGLAWASSAMFGVIRSSLNIVFKAQTPRPIVLQKLLDIGLVLTIAPFFILSVVATGALRLARDVVEDLPVIGSLSGDLGAGWWLASTLLPILVSFTAFLFLYWLIPSRRMPFSYVVAGAVLAAVLFEAVKLGFNLYLENFGRYDVIFGSLGAVVAFLFWVYLSATIMLLSAEVIAMLPQVMSGRFDIPDPGPKEPFVKRLLVALRGLFLPARRDPEKEKGQPGA